MFWMIPEPAKHRVELYFDGVFDHDPRAILLELRRMVPDVRYADESFDFLVDFSRVRDLPSVHAKSGEQALDWLCVNGLRRCASILASATQRMVVSRRTGNDPRFDYFLSRDEAEWWLAKDLPHSARKRSRLTIGKNGAQWGTNIKHDSSR